MSTSDSIKAAASGETAPGTLSEGATTDAMILAALDRLDPTDDTQWTEAGLPAMEAINALLPASITRKRLEEVAPGFVRPTDARAVVGDKAPLPDDEIINTPETDEAKALLAGKPTVYKLVAVGQQNPSFNAITFAYMMARGVDGLADMVRRTIYEDGGVEVTIGDGKVEVSSPPPVDNDHVADGATQFSDAEVRVNERNASVEDRLSALEADNAFLRKQFGWPTKSA